ncbi:MAG: hypothetical protein ACKO1N_11680 [Erythrobacter sp.]
MSGLDWDAEATVHERDDGGSELQYNFAVLRQGALREMVAYVVAMEATQRARVVIEVAGGRSLNLPEILELSAKEGLA